MVLALDVAHEPADTGDARDREPISGAIQTVDHGWPGLGFPASPRRSCSRHYGIDPATIDPGTELLTATTGTVVLLDTSPPATTPAAAHEGPARRPPDVLRRSAPRWSPKPPWAHGWEQPRAPAGWSSRPSR